MNKRSFPRVSIFVLFATLCLHLDYTFAATPTLTPLATPAAIPHSTTERAPLSKFIPVDTSIELRHSSSEHVVHIPLADRWDIQKAKIHLEYTNSISLLKERSQLRVLMNGQLLAQFPLRHDQPKATADIILPTAVLKAGYNRLVFEVAQHYTLECEDPTAAELWTRIDPIASYLDLDVHWRDVVPSLARLNTYIDKKLWEPYAATLATIGTPTTLAQLNWGGAIAENIGLRLEFLPPDLRHTMLAPNAADAAAASRRTELETLANRRDVILLGRLDELRPFLSEAEAALITGPYLGIIPLKDNTESLLLVVSGIADNDVLTASRALGFNPQPFPDTAGAVITEYTLTDLQRQPARQAVAFDRRYLFSELGFTTTVYRGNKPTNLGRSHVRFWLPADVFSTGNENVELRLHLVYGAAMRGDSVLNFFLNDQFERSIALNAKEGALFRDYTITIPLSSLAPGLNTVGFEPQLAQNFADYCSVGQTANLALTLFDDSTITFPTATRYARLPDLRLLARTGFPVLHNGQKSVFQLTDNSSHTIASAWTLLAKMVQMTGLPALGLELTFEPPAHDRNAIILGTASSLPKLAMENARLTFGDLNQLALGLPSIPHGTPRPTSPLSTPSLALPDNPAVVAVTETGTLGDYTLLTEFAAPNGTDKTWIVLTAATPEKLYSGVQSLIQPTVWDNLQKDTVWWRDATTAPQSQTRLASHHIGQANTPSTVSYFFSQYPGWVLAATIGAFIALTYVLYSLIHAYARRRGDHERVD